MNYPQYFGDWVLGALFPKKCVGCGLIGDSGYLCNKCFNSIPIVNKIECSTCGFKLTPRSKCPVCPESPLDQLLVVSEYKNQVLRKAIESLKYKFVIELSGSLLNLVKKSLLRFSKEKGFSFFEDNPLIIPIPLHKRRLNWRGFNQSEILARSIADFYNLSFESGILIRTKKSKPQARIKLKEERAENIRNVFSCADPGSVSGREIILVDDVSTTGATLNECARVLKENGAKRVVGFVVARG